MIKKYSKGLDPSATDNLPHNPKTSEYSNADQVPGVSSNNIEPTNEIAIDAIDGIRSRFSKKYEKKADAVRGF